jgi:hypothetical protein
MELAEYIPGEIRRREREYLHILYQEIRCSNLFAEVSSLGTPIVLIPVLIPTPLYFHPNSPSYKRSRTISGTSKWIWL